MIKEIIKRIEASIVAFKNPEIVEMKDVLTGGLTRRFFYKIAERELAKARRNSRFSEISLAFIDLDELKKVNDTQGHKAGDLYLKRFSQIVFSNIRVYDVFARWGGDEFVILLPGTNETEAKLVIQRIYKSFPQISWGISTWTEGMSLEDLLAQADARMYQSKTKKKAGVTND